MTFLQNILSHSALHSDLQTLVPALGSVRHSVEKLPEYDNIAVSFDPRSGTYRCGMQSPGRPVVTSALLKDIRHMQDAMPAFAASAAAAGQPVNYFVFASNKPGVFSLGGDLRYFAESVQTGDRHTIHAYARACVDVVHRNLNAFGLPLVTVALVQGDALGGGFETALSFDVIIAERSAKMGLPEVLFNLFPGMGAYSVLSRRLDAARAERLIMSGKIYTAEELHAMGLVDVLAEDGQGEAVLAEYIEKNKAKHNAHLAIYKTRRRVNPILWEELRDVVDIWVDAVFNLSEADRSKMARLTAAQERRFRSVQPDRLAASA